MSPILKNKFVALIVLLQIIFDCDIENNDRFTTAQSFYLSINFLIEQTTSLILQK